MLVAVLFSVARQRWIDDACVTTEGTPVASRDSKWSAWIENTGCDFGFGTGYAVWNVRLQAPAQSNEPTTIFSTDAAGEPTRPTIRWSADRQLRISTPNARGISFQAIRFSDVVISYDTRPHQNGDEHDPRKPRASTALAARGRPRR